MTSIPLPIESGSSAKWEKYGDKYEGRISRVKETQDTDMNGQPKFFAKSGDPIMIWLITLEQPTGDQVTLWAKGGNWTAATGSGESMQTAIARAVRAAGGELIEEGAELAVAYTGETKPAAGLNAAKLFTATYRLPKSGISVPDDLFSS